MRVDAQLATIKDSTLVSREETHDDRHKITSYSHLALLQIQERINGIEDKYNERDDPHLNTDT